MRRSVEPVWRDAARCRRPGNIIDKTKAERLAQQRICKRRKYLEIKNDPELYALKKEKQRAKYKKRKEEKKQKSITERSPREQRKLRKQWKENSKKYRERLKQASSFPNKVTIVNVEADELSEEKSNSTEDPIGLFTKQDLQKAERKIRLTNITVPNPEYHRFRMNLNAFLEIRGTTQRQDMERVGADGVGAFLKRTADRMVTYGRDIGDFDSFCEVLKENVENIIIKIVKEDSINKKETLLPKNLKPFRDTLSVHQIRVTLFNLLLSLYPISPIAIVTRTRTAELDLKRYPLFNLLGQNLEARVTTVSITTRAWWLVPRPARPSPRSPAPRALSIPVPSPRAPLQIKLHERSKRLAAACTLRANRAPLADSINFVLA
ncbi:unnamed protein product [Euphydryas editha]|uniref:Uncharacterized protein n=1 Tax=Euphydryas editha TaxID=104508 RepID=A0AAU9TWA8_EUPED|nr:unnamed protein product [Euphydryas editha]